MSRVHPCTLALRAHFVRQSRRSKIRHPCLAKNPAIAIPGDGARPGNRFTGPIASPVPNPSQDHIGSAVAVRCLELVSDVALARQRQALVGDGWSDDVAAQPLKLLALVGGSGDTAVERKARRFGQAIIIAFLGVSRYRLQRERFPPPLVWADCNPVVYQAPQRPRPKLVDGRMHRHPPPQVGKGEGDSTIPSIGGPKN